jgi:intracellular septation protein
MIASFLQTLLHYAFYREFKKMHVIGFVLALLFGAMTLLLRDPVFIKWKFSILHWLLALVLLWRVKVKKISPVKELLELTLKAAIPAPEILFNRLNNIWFAVLVVMGLLNLVLAYYIFPGNDKAWGIAKMVLVFVGMLALIFYTMIKLQSYIPEQNQLSEKE